MATSEHHLQLRGVTWHFRRRVPSDLQAELGKREFTGALSRDLHIARRLRNEMLVETDRQISQARSKLADNNQHSEASGGRTRIVRSEPDARALAARWMAMVDMEAVQKPFGRRLIPNELEIATFRPIYANCKIQRQMALREAVS